MNSEIEVPETPNWLQELEAKREKRLKARLGHEAGAGAPCLKCGDKCPGLDLHFWRKCCKICKCAKEEHEVQDDDIYGWAQFQLLGSKPNKVKRKIVLPGKKDEVELDWAPKGHNETVDKYLKTLPPEQLPVKGSQAAQDRKQLLQKQIPVHDIDPTLCHELTEQELKQMNDYITHVKQTSVGVGQIVSLSSIIKGNLHTLNPSEAAIIASRYAKGVPLSEIVKLQVQNRAGLLKQQGLNQNLTKLSLNDPHSKNLPGYSPNPITTTEQNLHPLIANKIHDVNYPGYTNNINQSLPNAQFATGLKPGQYKGFPHNHPGQSQSAFDPTINEKYLQNPNFDPRNIPSQFISQSTPYEHAYSDQQNVPYNESIPGSRLGDANPANSAFVPYSKLSVGFRPEENYIEDNPSAGVSNYASSLPGRGKNIPGAGEFNPNDNSNQSNNTPSVHGSQRSYTEEANSQCPIYAKNLTKGAVGDNNFNKNALTDQSPQKNINSPYKNTSAGFRPGQTAGQNAERHSALNPTDNENHYENVEDLKERNASLPSYAPGKYSVYSDTQAPTRIPKNFRDLAFSTYDPSNVNPSEFEGAPDNQNYLGGLGPEQAQALGKNYGASNPLGSNDPRGLFDHQNAPYDNNLSRPGGTQYGPPNENYPSGFLPEENEIVGSNFPSGNTFSSGQYGAQDNYPVVDPATFANNQRSSGDVYNQITPKGNIYDRNAPVGQYGPPNVSYENYPGDQFGHESSPYGSKTAKKLSELHPGKINVNEDFLHPSQVTIGAIQDINYPEIKAATHGTNDFYEDYSPDSLREILNNIKLPDCHYCKKPFEENEFAITIDRANVLFHAECFKCAGCNQILADNVYFYNKETDNVYCGRDYAKIRGFPRCKACDELIFTKEYCLAENSTFHLKHFCCIECDRPLAGQDYTLEDEMPYCLPCFEQSKANKCNSCYRVIKPDEIGCNLNGVHFHAVDDCFACKMCKKPLMGKKLLLRNQKLYCSHDCFGADK